MIDAEEYKTILEKTIQGRYVTNADLIAYLKKIPIGIEVEQLGQSVQQKDIYGFSWGHGQIKILMWSQMHGNESTTTKAVFDLLNFFGANSTAVSFWKERCCFKIIPILNPDGAEAYTRVNANGVDLNRDAQDLSQPESKILREVYTKFQPDFCFNLHDQRTMYNVGSSNKSATVSFLAPAYNKARDISTSRAISMQVIVAMNQMLQKEIPGQIGRYDDGFNSNCVGDTFQMRATPTILFEAGHYPEDYKREVTRTFIFKALYTAIETIVSETLSEYDLETYQAIPENGKQFFDVLIQNVAVLNTSYASDTAIGVRYKEILKEENIHFSPEIEAEGNLVGYYGHEIINCLNTKDLEKLKSKPNLLKLLE